jgi:hypothetical protein
MNIGLKTKEVSVLGKPYILHELSKWQIERIVKSFFEVSGKFAGFADGKSAIKDVVETMLDAFPDDKLAYLIATVLDTESTDGLFDARGRLAVPVREIVELYEAVESLNGELLKKVTERLGAQKAPIPATPPANGQDI